MSTVAYMRRAVTRARTRGIVDTVHYSYQVARKRIRAMLLDLRYGGRVSRTARDWTYNPEGRYGNEPTDIYALDAVFDRLELTDSDVLVDVGCGDGRAIAYFLSRGVKNKIIGIELLKDAYEIAARRFAPYPNVQIIHGDATKLKTDGTVFYLYSPFESGPAATFERLIRDKAALILYSNPVHVDVFSPRDWQIETVADTKLDYRQFRFAVIKPRQDVPICIWHDLPI